jgi:hypothetical protein
MSNVRYLVFDIESVADPELVARLRYPGQKLTPLEAVTRYRSELMEKYDSDFIPYTFQVPVSVAIVKVGADCRLIDLVTLDEPAYRPHVITEHFWRGWEKYHRPTLVAVRLLYSEMGRLDSAHNTLVLLPLARKKRTRHRNGSGAGLLGYLRGNVRLC